MIVNLFPPLSVRIRASSDITKTVSCLQQCEHYICISSWIFAQDDTFSLIALDIISRKREMGQIALVYKKTRREIADCESVTTSKRAPKLDQDSKRARVLQKAPFFEQKQGRTSANLILRKLEDAVGRTLATNEERKIYQSIARNMAAKEYGAAVRQCWLKWHQMKQGNHSGIFFWGQ